MDAGGLPVFSSANQAHQLNNNLHLQQRHLQQQQQQQQQQQPQHQLDHLQQGIVGQDHSQYHSTESIPPKRVDRFRRRIENYRRRQTDCEPRFEQTFSGVCEQQNIETTVLQKRFLESKAKRAAKKTDKKPDTTLAGNLQSSVLVQQKFLKRPSDDVENGPDGYEPPHKLQHNGELTKFSVEIVQQLEFTTSAANSQPQQISTNVTVKALTNTSVKSEGGQNQNNGSATGNQNISNNNNASNNNQRSPQSNISHDIGNLVECKQEPDHDFADLEAAFEKDAAANGLFKGLSDIIGDATNDESDTFKELISDLSDFHPELLDFEEKPLMEIKTEDGIKQEMVSQGVNDGLGIKGNNNSMPQYQSQFNENQMKRERGPYNTSNGSNAPMSEMSPAAQTLKHMAEQHQHKNAMGMGYHPRPPQPQQVNPNRAAYEFSSFNGPVEYMNCATNNPVQFHKGSGPGFDIKQEMMYSQQMPNQGKMGTAGPYSKQQYSPYGSPGSISNHGSPGANYMPPRGPGPGAGGPNRPSSGPNSGNQGATTLQMKQTQQLHISQQGPGGHGIQVSAGQHVHLSGDLKSNVSVAAQQGVYFNQHDRQQQHHHQQQQQQQQQHQQQPSGNSNNPQSNGTPHSQTSSNESYTVSQTQTINFTQQNVRRQQQPNTSSGADVNSPNVPSNMSGPGMQGPSMSGPGMSGPSMSGPNMSGPSMSGPNMSGPNMSGSNMPGSNMSGPNMPGSTGNMSSNNVQSGPHPPGMTSMSQNQHISSSGLGPSSVGNAGNNIGPQRLPQNTNTATIQSQNMGLSMNIAQNMGPHMGPQGPNIMGINGQNIPNNGSAIPNMGQGGMNSMVPNAMNSSGMGAIMPNNMGPAGSVNMRHEQAKFLQQQQMMRAQAMQQQQQHIRPPPPEYKASQAQMMQAQMMQNSGRFPSVGSAAAMRRIGQQPIPPTSQMMRPQHSMYMQHPGQHPGGQRMGVPFGPGIGQRPPNVQVGPEGMPMGSQQEWRHLLMSQQQNMTFSGNGMRPGFNPNHQPAGFGMTNSGGPGMQPGMQMTPAQMQQQMLRNQQQQQHQQQNQSNLQQNQPNNQNAMQQMLAQQQQQQQQGMMSQMQINSINSMHLSQSQTLTMQQQQQSVMSSFSQTQTQQHSTSQTMMASQQNETNSMITSSASSVTNNADFNEFFENLPVGDTSGFLEQDFLNSLENIQDILQ